MDKRIEKLIDTIRKERIRQGYSLRQLAKECDTSHSCIFDLEHSYNSKIDLIKLLKVCEVLEIDFYDLLVKSGLIFIDKVFHCYEIDVYLDDELFYKFDVSETTEDRAIKLLNEYLEINNLIYEDCELEFEIREKIPRSLKK